ncbi:transferase [Pontibacter korlensis]|uniref:Transferase n=1 Tax=Pontibacter korlensis TaxID=400092 RepID=A0A0E3UUP1_9BACT|nr:transferase [Pontibacter korlensis]AKD01932.1 transferase [Pontibacter korlensis]
MQIEEQKVNLSQYKNALSKRNQLVRLIWCIVWALFASPLPRSIGSGWKRFLLRLFGAKIHSTAVVYSSVRIYMPWNLEMKEYACLAPEVDCYNVAKVTIGNQATVSQKTYLCAASHNISHPHSPLITAPIVIEDQAWIGADVFIGMGVTVGEGAVVGARACVFKNVEPWTVVGGNPAKAIKKREFSCND